MTTPLLLLFVAIAATTVVVTLVGGAFGEGLDGEEGFFRFRRSSSAVVEVGRLRLQRRIE